MTDATANKAALWVKTEQIHLRSSEAFLTRICNKVTNVRLGKPVVFKQMLQQGESMILTCPDLHENIPKSVGFTTNNQRLTSNNYSTFPLVAKEEEENHRQHCPVASCGPVRASAQPPACASCSNYV